jgi:hypothetical protein
LVREGIVISWGVSWAVWIEHDCYWADRSRSGNDKSLEMIRYDEAPILQTHEMGNKAEWEWPNRRWLIEVQARQVVIAWTEVECEEERTAWMTCSRSLVIGSRDRQFNWDQTRGAQQGEYNRCSFLSLISRWHNKLTPDKVEVIKSSQVEVP